ncbi:MAG: hypothetical protein QXS93_03750 [Candidatus Micrarchaeia archaeon]
MANKKISVGALMLVRMINDDVCYNTPSGEQVINRKAIKRLQVRSSTWNELSENVKACALVKK